MPPTSAFLVCRRLSPDSSKPIQIQITNHIFPSGGHGDETKGDILQDLRKERLHSQHDRDHPLRSSTSQNEFGRRWKLGHKKRSFERTLDVIPGNFLFEFLVTRLRRHSGSSIPMRTHHSVL